MKAPKNCFITDLPTVDTPSGIDWISYHVTFEGIQKSFAFSNNHSNSEFVEKNKHILKGLFFNGRLPVGRGEGNYYDNEILERIILEANYPKTPKEKSDNLLLCLGKLQNWDGEPINEFAYLWEHLGWVEKLFLRNRQELEYYFDSLSAKRFITCLKDKSGISNIIITTDGLNYLIDLESTPIASKNCFIAMAFSPFEETMPIREAIKNACVTSGFRPIVIDEEHIANEVTINDAMLKAIKESKFLIADFTFQKHGVYFEAGYALGRGIPVIYCCRKDHFEQAHFDTNHYPHITYDTPADLYEKLINKIGAWIL
jgi:nucleoside 2-deoxyribosyltransferase